MRPTCCKIVATTIILIGGMIGATSQERPTSPMPPMMQGGTMPMMRGMQQNGMMPMMGMADHVEGRIAFLKAELKITDAQLPQWNTFADALRSNARRGLVRSEARWCREE